MSKSAPATAFRLHTKDHIKGVRVGLWLVGADVLASSRFAISPLLETVAAMKAFAGKGTHPALRPWLDAHAPAPSNSPPALGGRAPRHAAGHALGR